MGAQPRRLPIWKYSVAGLGQIWRKGWVLPIWILASMGLQLLFFAIFHLARTAHNGEIVETFTLLMHFDIGGLETEGFDRLVHIEEAVRYLIPIATLAVALITAAATRAALLPQDRSFAYLRLGRDDFRIFMATIINFTFFVLAYLVAGVGAVLLWEWAWPILLVTIPLTAWVVIFFMSRFHLANPICIAEEKIGSFQSWRLTRGLGWRLVVCYFLTYLIHGLVAGAVAIVWTIAVVLVATGVFGAPSADNVNPWAVGSITDLFSAPFLASFSSSAISGAVLALTVTASQARLYEWVIQNE